MKIRILILITITAMLPACLNVAGQFGYTNQRTGATAGFSVSNQQPAPQAPPVTLPKTTGFKK